MRITSGDWTTAASARMYAGGGAVWLCVIAQTQGVEVSVAIDGATLPESQIKPMDEGPVDVAFPSLVGRRSSGWFRVEAPSGLHVVTLQARGDGAVLRSSVRVTDADPAEGW